MGKKKDGGAFVPDDNQSTVQPSDDSETGSSPTPSSQEENEDSTESPRIPRGIDKPGGYW